jgi:2,4-dienoyl-CoA reductase (NADPH2)
LSYQLLTPIRVGSLSLPNRIIMGSMHLGFEGADGGERLAAFYGERARGGAGLIVTGGVAPNAEGSFGPHGTVLDKAEQLPAHRAVSTAVHDAGGRILLQILHTGRYGQHSAIVAPSALRAPINRFTPRAMTAEDIERTVADYVRTAELAAEAGYDGVEVMASEGYLINQFLAPRTNRREDEWGGCFANRMRFAYDIVQRIRAQLGRDFLLMVRMSMLDLVEEGSTAGEVVDLAKAFEVAGADILNSGIGWHEARVPTIAHSVPAGMWTWATARVKRAVAIPVAASNRINTPELAEAVLARGDADLVSMARPLLADPHFAAKLAAGEAARINTCIGCNQGCLDSMFAGREATCLVNPRAGRERDFLPAQVDRPKRLAAVGGGLAGLAFAVAAAERGHQVTLFEATQALGGQFRLAGAVPGKSDYAATARFFAAELHRLKVDVRLGQRVGAADLVGFEAAVLATGIAPRRLSLPGADHPMVAGYEDILSGRRQAGQRVAIIGSGPIAFDVAAFLLGGPDDAEGFLGEWGVDRRFSQAGGLAEAASEPAATPRRLVMLQRSGGRAGGNLGKTTGWILKARLQRQRVETLSGVTYERIDDAGVHVTVDGEPRVIEADTVVVCAGQEPRAELAAALAGAAIPVHLVGGVRNAERLDALRAIEEGTRLGLSI